MRILLDTAQAIYVGNDPMQISANGRRLIQDTSNEVYFSVVSLWEIGVKRLLNRPTFQLDAAILRRELLLHGFTELPLVAEHTLAVSGLPALHKDPFDRLLLCQAMVEGLTFMTSDDILKRYPAPMILV